MNILHFPRSRGFNLGCGVVITVYLDNFQTLTGIFLGQAQEDYYRRRRKSSEFIRIQLTRPFITIPKGELCVISVDKIQAILPGSSPFHNEFDNSCFNIWEEKGKNQASILNISCNRDTPNLES